MFRNSILRYLTSAMVYDGNNDQGKPEKTPAEIEREAILASIPEGDKVRNNEEDPDEKEEKEEGDKEEKEEKEDDDEKEEKLENETDEQKIARIAAKKLERKEKRMQKRIDTLTAKLDLTEKEKVKLEDQLKANPDKTLTEEEVQRRAERLAADLVTKRENEEGKKLFQRDCDNLQAIAIKVDKDFDKKMAEVAEDVGAIPQHMIGVLSYNLDNQNGGEVLAYLANNPDEYEDIRELSEGKMTAKLIRLSDKIKIEKEKAEAKEKEKKTKEKEKPLPDPIEPINTGRDVSSSNQLPANPTKNMDTFVRIRNQQELEAKKARGGF